MHNVRRKKTSEEQKLQKKKAESGKIVRYNELIKQYRLLRSDSQYDQQSFDLTTKIININPEYYSIWNFRRLILSQALLVDKSEDEIQEVLSKDLALIESKLRTHPKVYWIWNHRRWCLEYSPKSDWKRELKLVNMMLELDARNFHGWQYRRYVIDKLGGTSNTQILNQEFEYTTQKINANFSNFSAWHNRGNLMPLYLEANDIDRSQFLQSELDYIRNAIYTDPDDQSAWIYHKWLINKAIQSFIVPDISTEKLVQIVEDESKSISELYEVEPNCKWCCHALINLVLFSHQITQEPLTKSEKDHVLAEVKRLEVLDPKRRGRYKSMELNIS